MPMLGAQMEIPGRIEEAVGMDNSFRISMICVCVFLVIVLMGGCRGRGGHKQDAVVLSPAILARQCAEVVGKPRVEHVSEHVWAAISYDLASTVLIHTDEGNVIVDVSGSPAGARKVKAALSASAPSGPVKAIIYTHSHIDHIGGATVWASEGVPIWATDAFLPHFFKQYGLFRPAEMARGMRQFGYEVPVEDLPCSSIGARIDIRDAMENGVRLPTNTFSGSKTLEIGKLQIEMVEAHGETHDTLFVWIGADKTLIAGDNFYWAFPNLYTVRGTSPRPVNEWITSLDAMRRKEPEHLIPMHTKPINGKVEIAEALTNYRDAIQYVRDTVVRLANRGEDIDTIAESVKLPPRLANLDYLQELYGQVDWSARAIYTNELGWFDGRADRIYPLSHVEIARREVALFGGPEKVFSLADQALQSGDARWAIYLLAKLSDSGLATGGLADSLKRKLAASYRKLAESVYNTNGRAYLLQSAIELTEGVKSPGTPRVDEALAARIPLATIFNIMVTRLIPEKSDVLESAQFVFPDENKKFVLTVRHGVAEVVEGDPLPGTPAPVATMTTDGMTYRKLALKLTNPAAALASGKIKIEGSYTGFLLFMSRFQPGA